MVSTDITSSDCQVGYTLPGLLSRLPTITGKVYIFADEASYRIEGVNHWTFTEREDCVIIHPIGLSAPQREALEAFGEDSESLKSFMFLDSLSMVEVKRQSGAGSAVPRLRGERIPHLERGGKKTYGNRRKPY